jgi:Uma2 family endonuclease
MLTDIEQLDLSKRYTYADYLTWRFDEMVELIRGKVFRRSPAPNVAHQRVSGALFLQIGNYLLDKECQIFAAPFDVRLPLPQHQRTPAKIDTVVQPDLSIICDPHKLDVQGCNGAPDWIIEILSPATSQKDFTEKYEIYQFAGVREYWVVHPHEATVLIYHLDDQGEYQLVRKTPFLRHERTPAGIFPDFGVLLERVFE